MLRSVTREEMQWLDRMTTERYGIPSIQLMENAGREVCDVVQREFSPRRVLVFSGKGNNGGDGFVAARHLVNRGYSVQVLFLEDPLKLKSDPLVNYTILEKIKVPLRMIDDTFREQEIQAYCKQADLVIDAIFGIGINSPVSGKYEKAISAVNQCGKRVVSVDIPSGLNADTGAIYGVAVKAWMTVALAYPKVGFFVNEGPTHAGRIEVVDIGIPRELESSLPK